MSIYEYDQEKHLRQERETAREDGLREGHEEGRRDGLRNGIEQAKKIFKLSQAGKTPEEISEICGISVENVRQILD